MKKLFLILTSMLLSLSIFASKELVPTTKDYTLDTGESAIISCADAAAQALALGDNETATETVNVIGYITKTNGIVSREQQTFYMDDEKGSGKETLQAYWANLPEDDKNTPLAVGDKVILTGYLIHYVNKDGTIHVAEIKNGNVTIIEHVITKIDTIAVDVCEAIEEGLALNSGEYTNDIFEISGVVSAVTNTNDTYHSQSFDLECTTQTAKFTAYNCTITGDYVALGDSVVVLGKLTNFNGTIEIASGKAWVTKKRGLIQILVGIAKGCENMGSVSGSGAFYEQNWVHIEATPNEGYYFVKWSDGNDLATRDIYLTSDTTLLATFAPKKQVQMLVGVDSDSRGMGYVSGSGIFYEQDWARIEAIPNEGYHFVEWSDGNAFASRDIHLTSDTTLFATFAPGSYGGKCGEHLYWAITNDTLVITGTGAMDVENYTTWRNYYIYCNDVIFPDGMISIANYAFDNDYGYVYGVRNIVIPASVEYIGHHAFASCRNLKKWQYLGNNVELGHPDGYWPNYILPDDSDIQFVQGPATLITECGGNYNTWNTLDTLIITNGYYADYDLPNLSYYDASKAADYSIGGYYRSNLLPYRTFFFPEDIVEIGDFALMNARYLGGVTIPAGVTRIGESAFEECRSLDSVVFAGNNLETIGDWAFYNCHDLKKINLPEGVQEVGKAAFFNCTYLSELTIPSTMQRIADNGFGACAKMAKMYVNALVPPAIEEKTFEDVDRSIPVFVPKGTLERYQGDRYWSEFFNITEYDAPTGILNASAQGEDNARKVLRNGQVLIIRGDQTYTVLGDKL